MTQTFTDVPGVDKTDLPQRKPRKKFTSDALELEIVEFVFQSHARSGYESGKGARRSQKTVLSPDQGKGLSIVELLPVLGILVLAALVINEHRSAVFDIVQSRFFWLFVSCAIVYVALSGIFHSIINRVALLHYSPQYGFVFVYPSSRRQFALEGLFHGGWSFFISLAALGIAEVLPALRTQSSRDELLRMSLLAIGVSYTILYFTFLSKYRWMAMP